MNFEISCQIIPFQDWSNLEERVIATYQKDNKSTRYPIYLVFYSEPTKAEKDLYHNTLQTFIKYNLPINLTPVNSLEHQD